MTAATIPPSTEAATAAVVDELVTEKHSKALFRFSMYVHVGQGAESCDEGEKGTCGSPLHFHAYVRLPNQFQHNDVRQKALAAKARRVRQLRDPETDAHAILEADLDEVARQNARELVIDEIVGKDWWKRQLDAMKDVEERDEFEHIDRDRERIREIQRLPTDERPSDELAELERHIGKFGELVDERIAELEKPLRDSLADRDINALVDLLRDDRITAEGNAAFLETYRMWQMYAGTLKPSEDGRPVERIFQNIDQLIAAAPEVVEALGFAITELEQSARTEGNS